MKTTRAPRKQDEKTLARCDHPSVFEALTNATTTEKGSER